MLETNGIGKMSESYLYENEELIKTYTTQGYEQEGGEILIDCKCMECYMNHDKKSRHVQLETGKSYCENSGESQTLEEYISDQQNITLEESKELIKNFYSLDKFSKKIRVPVEFLERLDISLIENKIRIPYYAENNQEIAARFICKDNSSRWEYGSEANLYGLWKVKEFKDKSYIVLTRSEESTIRLWLNGIQALGKPLNYNFKEINAEILNKFEKVYIINKGSLHFTKMIKNACENLPYEKIYIIDLFSNQDEKSLNLENIHTFAKKISQKKYNENVGIKEPLLFDNIVKPTIEKNVVLGKRIAEKLHTKFYANSLYTFNNTYYERDSDKSTTKKEILKINENIKNSLITATLNYLKIKHAVTYNELDLDNVIFLNGRLNLKTKEFLPHNPDVFNIFRLNVNYIEESDIETNSAVEEALSKLSEKDRKALLQFMGYSLTNRTDLNTFCCVIGKKSNKFKSILSDMLVKIIGIENVCNIPLQKFNDKFKNDLIANKLLNIVNELPKEEVKDVITFKNLVARDTIEIKCTGKETTYIKNVTKHLFFASELPTLKEGIYDERFFKQMLVIKCDEEITIDEEKLLEKSALEYTTSLAIREYLEMLDNEKIEFANKEESDRIVAEYKASKVEDSIQEFINSEDGLDSCFEKEGKKAKEKEIYKKYKEWCEYNDYKTMKRVKLFEEILKTGKYVKAGMKDGYPCLKKIKLDI